MGIFGLHKFVFAVALAMVLDENIVGFIGPILGYKPPRAVGDEALTVSTEF